jgi:hypothetical protein
LCYFTFGGGFGSCIGSGKDRLTLNPVYHTLWLYRKLGYGDLIGTSTSSETVEAYGFLDKAKTLILVNKNNTPVKVVLKSNLSDGPAEQYILNRQTYSGVKYLSTNEKVPQLKAEKINIGNKLEFEMQPFEVRGIAIK